MALPPIAPTPQQKTRVAFFRRTRHTLLSMLVVLFVLCLVFAWTTRDAMSHLPFIAHPNTGTAFDGVKKPVVDLSPWQTAQALASLAVTAEEREYARESERLADHEVDQAFASALRIATMQAQHRVLAGEALTLSQKVDQFQQLVNQDQALVKQLTPAAGSASPTKDSSDSNDDTDLDIAKAQLGLDSDELADLQQDLARASGDQRAKIQSELAAHEASMRKYDGEQQNGDGQIAALSVARYGTLAGRVGAWFKQRSRRQLIEQAMQQAQDDIHTLTDQHNALESKADASGNTGNNDRASKLATLKTHSAERQLLSIYDDRIQTEQQLAAIYSRWAAQVLLQHRVVLHLILQSSAFIAFILICMVLGDRLVRRLMRPSLDRRQLETMRMILELAVQVVGVLLILIVLFGAPHQTPTVLGLATAALTFALQDFVLAFFGWFRLVGKRGIRVGDWVEINGVGGEVTEIGLMTTTLLETGSLSDRGYPTGRRITFMNSFAIRGQYFNFSTTGQWTWDEITVAVPASVDAHTIVDRILKSVQEETHENARVAEREWKRGTRGDGLSQFRTDPSVNLRPSGSGVDLEVRYVTRASERFEMRNRLYRHVITLLQEPAPSPSHPR
ncbi:MAG TPA: mechanosensitive ion channel domain-containing protein [Edaphobacter sp.]|jgi:small-conductance mechanosensitive channel|nr:mechanosensitive ion channel domain-containing protein [Edaphobacter sp.]